MPCINVLSLPLFFCDCLVLCQFYSGTVFLYICVYVTVLFIEEEEEAEKEEEDNRESRQCQCRGREPRKERDIDN